MSKRKAYLLGLLFGLTLGIVLTIGLTPAHTHLEIFCESGTEVDYQRQYELWSAKCNEGNVYGPVVTVTMID